MFLILLAVFLALVYKYSTRNHDYWLKKGVKHDQPVPFFGNSIRQYLQRTSITDIITEKYWKYSDERIIGYYSSVEPVLIVRDPELIKHVLVTDFAFFYQRGLNRFTDYVEPLFKNLFFADGDLWKLLRQRMTPAFSSGKLKAMFSLIVEKAEQLQKVAEECAKSGKEVDVRDMMARYTTDFIGAVAFGIEADSLNDENGAFRQLGKDIFKVTKRDIVVVILKIMFPEMLKKVHYIKPEIEERIVNLMKSIMSERSYKPSGRNDFIDLLLELKGQGKIVGESIEHKHPDGSPTRTEVEFDDLVMAAQIYVFFAAGFETSSLATSYTLHQLAFHPEVQSKCQDEIDAVLKTYDNKLCYDAVREMKYLEMAFKEAMRMYPPLGFLIRKCTQKYTLPGTDVTIDAGTKMVVPLQALHMDEKYFERPEEFLPERFDGRDRDLNKHVYMPFGEGPRACIGERLGQMQSLAGLAAVLHKFSVAPSTNTLRKPITDPAAAIIQSIKGGLPLKLLVRKKAM
ncbi:cytochrome P450 6B6 [Plutella xylostella]|uniref:cytochrome P450 6B6 n=1 Tax=Plutella xylostella TaxID=51655 RepID=UPI0020329487|nr:cytochrome P450 6B6 [Plutella xylostella]